MTEILNIGSKSEMFEIAPEEESKGAESEAPYVERPAPPLVPALVANVPEMCKPPSSVVQEQKPKAEANPRANFSSFCIL